MKKKGMVIRTNIVFILFGMLFCIIGIALIVYEIHTYKNTVEVTTVIRDITNYFETDDKVVRTAYVNFEFEGNMYYAVPLPSYSPTMQQGDEITILVNPKDPDHLYFLEGKKILIILIIFGMGAISVGSGSIPLFKMVREKIRKKKLILNGNCLLTKVDSVEMAKYSVNGESPYIVCCSYEDTYTGTTYKFKSEDLWYVPKVYFHNDMKIKVYVDWQDYSKYYMEVEESEP